MKQNIQKIIEIPKDVEADINGSTLIVKGKEGDNKRQFKTKNIKFEKKDNKIILSCKNATKREKKVINTINVHIKNIIKGVEEKFEYSLKICSSHFPMSVEIKDNEAIVKNFLGEKIPRKIKILEGVEIDADKENIIIKSVDKELAGQTAANFEKATWIKTKDRRIFQDGIFITHKPGREI